MFKSVNGMAERFREQLASAAPIELPGCHDALSAMLLEAAGFETIFLSGYGVAASWLGNPDIGLTSLAETSIMAKNVASRVGVPLVVDADNGYGNEDNVIRTVYELEFSGAAAIVMEDQVLPKRCGHTAEKKILPLHLYMKKLECALKARQTAMSIVARTDAMSLDEAINRAKTFHLAGADVLLIDGLRSMDNIRRVADEVPGHKQINLIGGGVTPMLPAQAYFAEGFKIVQYSTVALYAAVRGMKRQFAKLRETHDLSSVTADSEDFREFQSFIEAQYEKKIGRAPSGPRTSPPSLAPPDRVSS
jgi:2-methylisocitrate lyase-like PEP mutase family enzyme